MTENNSDADKKLLDFALEETHDGWWDWNVKENTFYLSPNYWKAFGHDPVTKNHLASEWQEITHPEDLVKVQHSLGKHFETRGKNPYVEEVRFKHRDGHWSTVICRGKTIEWDDDWKPVRFIGVHTDITHLKNREEQINLVNTELERINSDLKDSREFQALILKYNPDLIFVKDSDYKIVLANDAFINVYPKEQRDKVIGFTTVENYSKKEAEQFLEKDKEAFENGYSEAFENILFPDGVKRILHTQKILFKDNRGSRFVLGIARDVTDLKKQEERLSQSNEELAQFAYRTSHDLKAPLATIKGLTALIGEDVENGDFEEVKSNIVKVFNQASKLEKLVVDILDLARADLKESPNQEVSVLKLIETIKLDLADLIAQKEIDVQLDIKNDLKIWSQESRLNQILTNLISNSAKYCDLKKEHRYVRVSIVKDKKIKISVVDNGVGISTRDQEKLFDMFSRFNVNMAEGSGLGMSIVKKSVEAMGGSISIASNKQKTSINIELPVLGQDNVT